VSYPTKLEFSANLKAVQDEMERLLSETEPLRRELLALADRDVEAFTAVAACYGMPRETDAEKAARTAALQAALKIASEVPYTTAERCLAVLELAEPVGAKGNANVVSDAATSLYLAQAALRCAIVNVDINLKLIKDEIFVERLRGMRDRLLTDAGAAFAAARQACEQTLGVTL
jgi:formiminotetrahydrofolate cyclodeaminase